MSAREQYPHVRVGAEVVVQEQGANNVRRSRTVVVVEVAARGFSGREPGQSRRARPTWYRWSDVVSVPNAPRPERHPSGPLAKLGDLPTMQRVLVAKEPDPPAPQPQPAVLQPPAPFRWRFSAWLQQWLDAYPLRSGINMQLAVGVGVNPNAITFWKQAARAPTERDVVELAAYFDAAGTPLPEGADWLEAVVAMVDRDIAAGVRRPGRDVRSKVAAMLRVRDEVEAYYGPRASGGKPKAPPDVAPQPAAEVVAAVEVAEVVPPPVLAVEAVVVVPAPEPQPANLTVRVNGVDVTGSAADLRALLGLGAKP